MSKYSATITPPCGSISACARDSCHCFETRRVLLVLGAHAAVESEPRSLDGGCCHWSGSSVRVRPRFAWAAAPCRQPCGRASPPRLRLCSVLARPLGSGVGRGAPPRDRPERLPRSARRCSTGADRPGIALLHLRRLRRRLPAEPFRRRLATGFRQGYWRQLRWRRQLARAPRGKSVRSGSRRSSVLIGGASASSATPDMSTPITMGRPSRIAHRRTTLNGPSSGSGHRRTNGWWGMRLGFIG